MKQPCWARLKTPSAYVNYVLPEKIRLAKAYVARLSLGFDLRLLVATAARLCLDTICGSRRLTDERR